jgi:(2Fe-2S) ferredoxin
MTKTSKIITSFNFIGELSKIAYRKNQKKKIKYLKLETEEGSYWIKIPRQLMKQIPSLSPGCQLEIQGRAKQGSKMGEIKYKAQTMIIIATESLGESSNVLDPPIQAKAKAQIASLSTVLDSEIQPKPKAKVLLCGKSNCWKKGGQKVYSAIESVLSDRGLTQQIPIKKTGCLKQCKKAPTLIMMPDKARYNKVQPKQAREMVEQHLLVNY